MIAEPRERHLVTGANGQDGHYLVTRLLESEHDVHGTCRDGEGLARFLADHPGATGSIVDLRDGAAIHSLFEELNPTHVFNLAGNTSVARSWDFPAEAADVLGVGPVRLLEAGWGRMQRGGGPIRILQASSAEIFGDAVEVPQREDTPRRPVTPYGAAKAFAHEMVGVYRARGMHVSAAILYNHESPRRPESFVARKIAVAVARISLGRQDELVLGNIDVHRDWGFAPDYVDAMTRIVAQDRPDDYIVATGESHSVREFVQVAFEHVGVDDWERRIVIDPALYRPADPQSLVGDATRLRSIGWSPTVGFVELVRTMVDAELDILRSS